MTQLSSTQITFLEGVLNLRPRIAAFDCDGTLWSGDAGEGFFSWELSQGIVSEAVARWARPRYADYKAGKVREEVMCGEMVTMHRGLHEHVVEEAASTYFDQNFLPNIFPEMRELVARLKNTGCDVWAVSSTNLWVIRAAMTHFGIPVDRILAASVVVQNGVITDQLIRVPSGSAKPSALCEVLVASLDCAFGNSIWDREMLALSKHAFAINANPDLRQVAEQSRWTIYQPDRANVPA
jgi:phosphoserine phosphatase